MKEEPFYQKRNTMSGKRIKIWDIYKVRVYFEDIYNYKDRPFLILLNFNDLYFGFKITSNTERVDLAEYQIKYWQEAGLTKPSNIRLNKLICINENYVLDEKYGILLYDDRKHIIGKINELNSGIITNYNNDFINRISKRIKINLDNDDYN